MLSIQTDFLHWNARLITDANESMSTEQRQNERKIFKSEV